MGKIIVPARDRLAWHAQMVDDPKLPAVAFRVGVKIGTYFNNETGRTFVGYDRLAEDLGLSRATIHRSIQYLTPKTDANSLGRGHIGVIPGGGRERANEYHMILKTVSPVRLNEEAETVSSVNENRLTGETPTLKTYSSTKNRNSTGNSNFQASSWGGKRTGAGRKGHGERRQAGRGKQAVFPINSAQFEAWVELYQDIGDHRRVSLMRSQAERSRWGTWAEDTEWPPARGTPEFRRRHAAVALATLSERVRSYDDQDQDRALKDVTPPGERRGGGR